MHLILLQAQRAASEQSRVAEMAKFEAFKVNHEVFNVAKSETSKPPKMANEEASASERRQDRQETQSCH